MIGKITKGNGFTGVCEYVLDKDEARLIGGNMASTTPRQLAAEFRVFSQKNIRVQLPVEHISLSPSPLDRELDDSEWEALAIDLLDGLGMNMNQYIVVLHNDTEFEGKPGVETRIRETRTGFIQGISYELEGVAFPGHKLGRNYSWSGLQKIGITEQERAAPKARSQVTPLVLKRRSKGLEQE